MLIKEDALRHWVDNFYGYGSWEARFWFIAFEEGGGDTPREVVDKFNYFFSHYPNKSQPSLCDIRKLYKQVGFSIDGPRKNLFKNLYDYRFGKDAVLHGTWKNLIAFTHGFDGNPIHDLLTYQLESFALPSEKNEALLRLYPLPAHNHAWYYSWLDMPGLPFLKTRSDYEDYLFQGRIDTILKQLQLHRPEVVVMYGMGNITKLKKSIQSFYPDLKFKTVKAIPQQIPQHHQASVSGTKLLITTQRAALRHNRIETGFDWHQLGKLLRSEKP